MSDRASSDLPPPERSGETLWVVDVTAPLAPGRVRWVAGEAAARLQLPAEKLVALLENRIGPVTKPLPKASADRVAEVLDLAGAEVSIRAAGPADAGRTSTERPEARTPGASEAASSAAPDPATSMPDTAPAPRPVSEAPQEPAPEPPAEPAWEPASEPAPMPAPEPASASDAQPAPAAEAPERTPAEPTTGDARVAASADAGSSPEVDAEGVRARDQADLREAGGQAAADEPAPPGVQDAPTTDGAAEEPEQRAPAAQSAPPIGRPGTTGRGRDASDPDPWQSLGDDEDEAMLGAW
ncbi:MAG TPA: hypothetical protein VJ925_12130, partial [Longimicrobiales bacterium]|nr:hypothetical protein [Longimicrobiales bacterium]